MTRRCRTGANSSPSFARVAAICLGRAGVFHCGHFVGRAGARDGLGSGLRRPLAALQWHSDSALGANRYDDRVHASHHQRPLVLLRRGTAWCGLLRAPRAAILRAVAAIAAVAFTLIEAALGAFLVKLGLTAQSQSPLRAPYLALHLTNTLLLLAALTLTAHLLSRRTGYLRGTVRVVAPFGAIASIVVVLIVGVTGSLAALGDTLFPASSLGAALAQDFSATSGWLVRWRWTHPTVAVVASIFLIWLLVRAQSSERIGTIAAFSARADSFGGSIRAGRSRCGVPRAGLASDAAPAWRRLAVGGACGACGATDARAAEGMRAHLIIARRICLEQRKGPFRGLFCLRLERSASMRSSPIPRARDGSGSPSPGSARPHAQTSTRR